MVDDLQARIERDAFYEAQRARVGRADALSIAGIVTFVLLSVNGSIPIAIWAAVVFTQVACGLAVFFVSRSDEQPTWYAIAEWWWFRGTSLSWAAMPILLFHDAADLGVAWIIAFFVIFGLASDAIYMPQTYDTNLVTSGVGYAAPALIVLGLQGQWIPLAAILGVLFHVTATANGVTRIVRELIEKGVEARESGAETFHQARTDSLTGLRNRTGIIEFLDELRSDDGDQQISVCFVDLNGFKAVNDHHGYSRGDLTLMRFASELAQVLPQGWVAARFGGDEFIAAGPGQAGPQVAQAIAAIEVAPIHSPSARSISASVGVSVSRASEVDSLTMLHFAGTAVQEAKQTPGLSVLEGSAELQNRFARRARLEAELPEALSQGSIIAVAQPQIKLDSGDVFGVELLARWTRAGEPVPPNEFIPLISRLGLDHELDLLMIQHALDLIADTDHAPIQVSVNVSGCRLASEVSIGQIHAMLAQSEVDITRLTLEVTEYDDVELGADCITRIEDLVALGIRLSIDDFGTGYSSLTRLVSMPFSELKLDLTLIQRLGEPSADDLVRSITDFAHRNDMEVVAEGVETKDQLAAVEALGISFGQGYLFGRPVPIDELLAVFEAIDWQWSTREAA